MSVREHLQEALICIREANRVGWHGIDASEIEKIIYALGESNNYEVVSMLRKETIGTALVIGLLTRFIHGKAKINAEFWGMVITGILYWAWRIPILRDIDAIRRTSIRYHRILKVALATFAVLFVIDLITGGTLGFGGIKEIGEKYGFAFAAEGVTGVFKQLASDISGAFSKTPEAPLVEAETEVSVVPVKEEEEKLKEEVTQIYIPDTL